MPEQVQCPSCQQKLRVPDTLLGKKVKCPKCATVFEAKIKPAAEAAAPKADEDEGGTYIFKPEPPPDPKKKPIRLSSEDPEDDEDEDEDEDEDGERPRKKKKKRRHNAEALKKVSTPATGMQVTAVLTIIAMLLLAPLSFSASLQQRLLPKVPNQQQPLEGPSTTAKVWNGISLLISLLVQISIIRGASKMKRLESFRECLITSIICCVPLCTCCFTGVPFGIWSLVVINSPEVRPLFKS
jgi:predicted Zn finger-like uncharacterized protein